MIKSVIVMINIILAPLCPVIMHPLHIDTSPSIKQEIIQNTIDPVEICYDPNL
jgi:hypothetical protein